MARYQIVAPFYSAGRRYEIGDEVEHAGDPGLSLMPMPLDAEAYAAKLRVVLACQQSAPGLSLGGAHRFRMKLAKSLGAGEFETYQQYSDFIETWIATQRAAQEA